MLTKLHNEELGLIPKRFVNRLRLSDYLPALQQGAYIDLPRFGGAVSASGLLMGVGTSAKPTVTSVASAKFIEIRAESTATSGDNRLQYFRYFLSGGGGGECIRASTVLEAEAGTVRGAHISLELSSAGSVTGLGVGVDAQLFLPNAALAAGGTYAVVNAEIYNAGSSTDPGAVTEISVFRAVNGGDTTGAADVDDDAYLFSVQGFSEGTGNMFSAGADVAAAATLKCKIGATEYFMLLGAGEST